eukprot:m51a1_g1537 hypothetical protein (233) ;mRNA; r:538966-539664
MGGVVSAGGRHQSQDRRSSQGCSPRCEPAVLTVAESPRREEEPAERPRTAKAAPVVSEEQEIVQRTCSPATSIATIDGAVVMHWGSHLSLVSAISAAQLRKPSPTVARRAQARPDPLHLQLRRVAFAEDDGVVDDSGQVSLVHRLPSEMRIARQEEARTRFRAIQSSTMRRQIEECLGVNLMDNELRSESPASDGEGRGERRKTELKEQAMDNISSEDAALLAPWFTCVSTV